MHAGDVPSHQHPIPREAQPASGGLLADRLDGGVLSQILAAVSRVYSLPPHCVMPLLISGAALGAWGDALLHGSGPLGLNLSLWIATVAAVALWLRRRAALAHDGARTALVLAGVMLAAGISWRNAEPLCVLALGGAGVCFALAAHRLRANWVLRAGVVRYATALGCAVAHAWMATLVALGDAARRAAARPSSRMASWSRAAAVARGLLIAAPLVAVFGALLFSADAVFAELVGRVLRFDFDWIASHVMLFFILAWLATGSLRGFLTGTELPELGVQWREGAAAPMKRPGLGITEIATVLAALDLLFLAFVFVQFRYLFGGHELVQITPSLTYAEYARRGFFELVLAVALVVPVLLAADWLLDRRRRRDGVVFGVLAAIEIVLVFAMAASALERLRLYRASYGLTESRFYATALLVWISAILIWLAATVLRGRRELFAFGALTSALAGVIALFIMNPDATIARVNIERLASAEGKVRFDVAYATRLSADAAPQLVAALPALPAEAQCLLARHLLRRWPPGRERSLRSWNWSAARAARLVRGNEARLRAMAEPAGGCPAAGPGRR